MPSDIKAAHARFMARFDDEVDPQRRLSPDRRAMLAKQARTKYFTELRRVQLELKAAAGASDFDRIVELRRELRELLHDVDLRAAIIVALGEGRVRR